MHRLTAVIKPVCGEQNESFYVGLNKTKMKGGKNPPLTETCH